MCCPGRTRLHRPRQSLMIKIYYQTITIYNYTLFFGVVIIIT
ncbi:hypothetical protein CLOBOL_00464 [Enterocloster bolteae ATCC BAA-613]|uniref:Uncharacterized protein n=1 Tax=Enterocloster bolteae (strain ATCC BAA-613 / DSM 15670 / CCUG 46953 / JCM 12243 / WAL 16351) TaxID=411902 RepID=A8RHN8_ENTBW|nr:hypothetical protein CLOBOL_00464 [Enterocloster bolteae ATCC BAA-613]